MAVLARAGCNQGACHGNLNGKGGLRLSLRGEDPAGDYLTLTRDSFARRVDPIRPDDSLLLLKAAGGVPHEGGVRFARDSREYRIIRGWIAGGMPDSGPVPLADLRVAPTEAFVVAPADHVSLRATARLADGTTRDVTDLCTFEPVAAGLVTVEPSGVVRRARFGISAVLVRYLDRQVAVPVAFLPNRSDHWPADASPVNLVDEHVFARLKKLRITPSPRADDSTFLRRVYLDTLGVLPTADEARRFLDDASADKRSRLIDDLLRRPEFADFWAQKWSDLLHNEERTLDPKGVKAYHLWLRRQMAEDVPLNEFARAVLSGLGSTYSEPGASFYRAVREPEARAEAAAQAFLGIRLQCAKCHNHPFDRWTQDDYYGFTALFSRIDYRIVENRRPDSNDHHHFDGEQIVFESRTGELKHPRNGEVVAPRLLGDTRSVPADDRIRSLGDWVADPANPYFARTQVNRVWYHLFGRGIVEPNDDFRLANPPAHPELLDALTRDFIASGFSLRHTARLILNSRTYQSASQPNESNADDEAHFARATIRPLEAEQLYDAIAAVLGASAGFDGYPAGLRAGQLPEAPAASRRKDGDGARFLKLFGKPDRLLSCECERSGDTTVMQAAQLLTGGLLQRMLAEDKNRIGAAISSGASDEAIIRELYLHGLARHPREGELAAAAKRIASADSRRAGLEDVAWGLINSKEFLLRR